MRRFIKKPDENGYVTLIAIIVIVAMGVLLAGLLPFSTTVTQSAAYTKNALQAQYIAEAGAKRAIVDLTTGTYHSSLTDSDLISSSDVDNSYSVTITPPSALTSGSSTVDGYYTVSSTGKYGLFSKKVTVKVTVSTGTLPTMSAGLLIGGSILNETGNSSVSISSNATITTKYAVASDVISSTEISKFISTDSSLSIPAIDFDEAMDGATDLPIPSSANGGTQNPSLSGGTVYKYDNDTVADGDSDLTINYGGYGVNGSEYAVVVVDGDLNWTSSSSNINGNIIFLVNGDVNIKSSGISFSSCFFYCNNLNIYSSGSNFGVKAMVRENINLYGDLSNINYINAFTDIADYIQDYVSSSSIAISNWAKGT